MFGFHVWMDWWINGWRMNAYTYYTTSFVICSQTKLGLELKPVQFVVSTESYDTKLKNKSHCLKWYLKFIWHTRLIDRSDALRWPVSVKSLLSAKMRSTSTYGDPYNSHNKTCGQQCLTMHAMGKVCAVLSLLFSGLASGCSTWFTNTTGHCESQGHPTRSSLLRLSQSLWSKWQW